jgi:hypothetical protein
MASSQGAQISASDPGTASGGSGCGHAGAATRFLPDAWQARRIGIWDLRPWQLFGAAGRASQSFDSTRDYRCRSRLAPRAHGRRDAGRPPDRPTTV